MATDANWDIKADVVVIGSGAAGLSAALTAAAGGASVVILEKADRVGGTTAMSGGGTWIPCNHHMLAAGHADSADAALAYIRAVMPPEWTEDQEPLWRTYLREAPAMLKFIEERTPLRFTLIRYPDLRREAPGSLDFGRLMSPALLSRNVLGRWRNRVRKSIRPQLFTYDEMILGPLMRRPYRTLLRMSPAILHRILTRRVGMGAAMVVGLLKGCLDHGCTIMTDATADELLTDGTDGGRLVGVAARIGGRSRRLRARKGIVLATGGFEWDRAMLERNFPTEWILLGSPRTNTGDGQRMAAHVGASFAHMDQATIYPVSTTTYEGSHHAIPVNQLDFAHCIMVNRRAQRFVSEGDRNGIARALVMRDPATGRAMHAPTWRIFDAQFAARNPFAVRLSKWVPGKLHKARTIARLAETIGLDPAALVGTVERFNGFVRNGRDADFARGELSSERFLLGDPARPEWNGALGTIEKPPFYATPYYLGILGTKGGPRTNERGQALRDDGSIIGGLYCAGSVMANFFGSSTLASGSTLGPFLTWGYLCGTNVLRENQTA